MKDKTNKYSKWHVPYANNDKYKSRVAYFCMEYGIAQPLKIYSGGLGFLAGSHMRSAFELKQNMIGIGMLWKYGYYDQVRAQDKSMLPLFQEKHYHFLKDSGIRVTVKVNEYDVIVKAMVLEPETFGSAPIYLLSTDVPENDYLARTITEKLYDSNQETRVAQSIVLGVGGAKLIEKLGGVDTYHMNEGHALPLTFYLYSQLKDLDKVREKVVFTTHTPVKAGNESHEIDMLEEMSFFSGVPVKEIKRITNTEGNILEFTPSALCMSKLSNGVSQLHGNVATEMWRDHKGTCEIIGITNAQSKKFWTDSLIDQAFQNKDADAIKRRKRELKSELFEFIADQTGKLFDPDVLTVVWARRFAGYKRADLLMRDMEKFYNIVNDKKQPIQIIWAGKPYPKDQIGLSTFRRIRETIWDIPNCAILTGYEMSLSFKLKKGADVWLNTPRRPKEASGTSGMTAAMNGAVNVSVDDGWIPEFGKNGVNSFVLPIADTSSPVEAQDSFDYNNLMDVLTSEIIPTYYNNGKWWEIVMNSMNDIYPYFDSDRMADEYYTRLYNAEYKINGSAIKKSSPSAV
ncbi:MAG: alpha-glucan family phosphorylase [Chitinophagales bacterium]|nr:alpha-glucan family phosphorylase [Chitinophagales bacterium]